MAIAAKYDKRDTRVYCLLGDGEIEEGQVWEALMAASFRGLDNLCTIIDRNMIQQDGTTSEIKDLEPIDEKLASCGWNVSEVDGHDIGSIIKALDRSERAKGRPTAIIARTVKGKGVSFMENNPRWHGRAPNADELEKALAEIG
jgi:transketolase